LRERGCSSRASSPDFPQPRGAIATIGRGRDGERPEIRDGSACCGCSIATTTRATPISAVAETAEAAGAVQIIVAIADARSDGDARSPSRARPQQTTTVYTGRRDLSELARSACSTDPHIGSRRIRSVERRHRNDHRAMALLRNTTVLPRDGAQSRPTRHDTRCALVLGTGRRPRACTGERDGATSLRSRTAWHRRSSAAAEQGGTWDSDHRGGAVVYEGGVLADIKPDQDNRAKSSSTLQ